MGTIKGILGCALALKKYIGGNSCGEIAALRSFVFAEDIFAMRDG